MARLWHVVTGGMLTWYRIKIFIEHASIVSSDALHVLVGTTIWVLIALLTRKPLTSWRPWLGLFALILFNEGVDLWVEHWPEPAMQYGEGFKDLSLTMLLPTLLTLVARSRPELFRPSAGRRRVR